MVHTFELSKMISRDTFDELIPCLEIHLNINIYHKQTELEKRQLECDPDTD